MKQCADIGKDQCSPDNVPQVGHIVGCWECGGELLGTETEWVHISKTDSTAFSVVEQVRGHDDEWTVLEHFPTLVEAQAFALVHYDTQIGQGDGNCKCVDCVNGWYVSPDWWKSLEVQVWNSDLENVIENNGCYSCAVLVLESRRISFDEAQGHAVCGACESFICSK